MLCSDDDSHLILSRDLMIVQPMLHTAEWWNRFVIHFNYTCMNHSVLYLRHSLNRNITGLAKMPSRKADPLTLDSGDIVHR